MWCCREVSLRASLDADLGKCKDEGYRLRVDDVVNNRQAPQIAMTQATADGYTGRAMKIQVSD
jgi:hypothetical protein